jgi:sec-independent protein translocase protein TatB
MPSFGDSAFIFILALLLFGPKKLPELARQLGKLMAEFRRASNEFRSQMDEELRLADQEEQRKKIAAMETAAPVTPALDETASEPTSTTSSNFDYIPTELPPVDSPVPDSPVPDSPAPAAEALPIASSGDLSLMPPSTGLPTPHAVEVEMSGNAALTPILDHIPHADPTASAAATTNGFHPVVSEDNTIHTPAEPAAESVSEAPIHG